MTQDTTRESIARDAILRELVTIDPRGLEMYHNDPRFRLLMDGIVGTLPALVTTLADQCEAATERAEALMRAMEQDGSGRAAAAMRILGG